MLLLYHVDGSSSAMLNTRLASFRITVAMIRLSLDIAHAQIQESFFFFYSIYIIGIKIKNHKKADIGSIGNKRRLKKVCWA